MKTHFAHGEVKEEVKNRFRIGVEDFDPELEKSANLSLVQLLAVAPPGATGQGLVRESEQGFLATITIQSPFRSFAAKAVSTNLELAVKKSLERMEDDLLRWRFDRGSGKDGRMSGMQPGARTPLAAGH